MGVVIGMGVREDTIPSYVHDELHLGFLAHPRTASHSVADALLTVGFRARKAPHHVYLRERPAGWQVFSTVRNTYDAIASWYTNRVSGDYECDALYLERMFKELTHYFPDPNRFFGLHLDVSTDVLRYESLEQGLQKLLNSYGLGPVILPKSNVNSHRRGRHYHDIITGSGRQWIEARFGPEIAELGYAW